MCKMNMSGSCTVHVFSVSRQEYPAIRRICVWAQYLLVDFAFSFKKPEIIEFRFWTLKSTALVLKEKKEFQLQVEVKLNLFYY